MPRRQGVAEQGGERGEHGLRGWAAGGFSGTRAVRRRCIVLAKISIRDGSEAGTFFSALTFGIFFQRPKKKRKKKERKRYTKKRHNTSSRDGGRIGADRVRREGSVGKLPRESKRHAVMLYRYVVGVRDM